MTINKRAQTFDLSQVRLQPHGKTSYDIFVGKEEVGGIDFTVDLKITKYDFVSTLFEGNPFIKKLMEPVPENYRFNYYYLDEIILWTPYRGSGIGGVALQKWFSTLKAPAVVALSPARIGNVPYTALLRFYKRNGMRLFKFQGDYMAITFIKHPDMASFVGDEEADTANNGGTPFFDDKSAADRYNLNKTNVTADKDFRSTNHSVQPGSVRYLTFKDLRAHAVSANIRRMGRVLSFIKGQKE
jgi:hypothetical protein